MEELVKQALSKEGIFTCLFVIFFGMVMFKAIPLMFQYHKETISKLGEDFKQSMSEIAKTFQTHMSNEEQRWQSIDTRLDSHGEKLDALHQAVEKISK